MAFDPLDGSSIVDTNFSVGTIFGVWPGDKLTGITGREQAAAGMGIYGPRTVFCIALKDAPGCHEFLLQVGPRENSGGRWKTGGEGWGGGGAERRRGWRTSCLPPVLFSAVLPAPLCAAWPCTSSPFTAASYPSSPLTFCTALPPPLQDDGKWLHVKETETIGEGKMFSPGNLRATFDNPAYEKLISYYIGEKYTLRYTGGMVRILVALGCTWVLHTHVWGEEGALSYCPAPDPPRPLPAPNRRCPTCSRSS